LSWVVPKTSDLPERVRDEIEARLRELRPLVDEYEELLAVEQTLAAEAGRGTAGPVRAASASAPPRATARDRTTTRDVSSRPHARTRAKKPSVQSLEETPPPASKRERAPRGAAAEAIVAALEHGSHTVSELAIVTAMSTQNIRNNLRRLLQARTVAQTKREGKTAYTLSSAP
jgi:hypothetical protein